MNLSPPRGVHWLHVYDEAADDPDYDPHWCFDLHHPEDCEFVDEPTWGECDEHKGRFERLREEAREQGLALTAWTEECEECETGGPVMRRHTCGFQFDLDNVGDDAFAFPREWEVGGHDHRQHHANIREGVYRVTWGHDGSGEDFCSWIEVHEQVDVRVGQ